MYRSSCLQDGQAAANPDHQLEKESRKCFSHALLKSPENAHIVNMAQTCSPTSLWLTVCCCVTHNDMRQPLLSQCM